MFENIKPKNMEIQNTFNKAVREENIQRLDKLTIESKPLWGTMNVAQMMAHVNVGYDMCYGNHKQASAFKKFIFKLLVKNMVVGTKPFPKNSRTAPVFVITDQRDFEKELNELKAYIVKTQELGKDHFEGKENISFGKLSSNEWSNLFQKHLDHHLRQFGV